MADTRIRNLTAGTPDANDEFAFTNGTTTYRSAYSNSKNAILDPGSTLGQKMAVVGAGSADMIDDDFAISYVIGGAGTTPISDTGLYPAIGMPYDGVFESVELYSGTVAGVATVDIYKGNNGTPPTVVAQSIIGGGTKPVLTGGTTYTSSIAWGTSTFSKNDVIAPNLDGVGTIVSLSIVLYGRKTAVN